MLLSATEARQTRHEPSRGEVCETRPGAVVASQGIQSNDRVKKGQVLNLTLFYFARLAGLEPATNGLEEQHDQP
jgi:hypothetical protein